MQNVSQGARDDNSRKAVADSAYFGYATVKNSQQSAEVKTWSVLERVQKRLRELCIAKAQHSKILRFFESAAKHVMQTFQCSVIKKSACMKLYTVQLEDWDCQQE